MKTEENGILTGAVSALLALLLFIAPNAKAGWTLTGSMNVAREGHTATLLPDGKVLVVGGQFFSSAELYDPATGLWTPTGSMSQNRAFHTATLLPNGKVLVAGGLTRSSGINNQVNINSELYDPATGTWSSAGAMTAARYNHTATLLPRGQVLVTGGTIFGGNLSGAEVYTPGSGWISVAPMTVPRGQHTATLLPNGKVLVAGGVGLSSAEIFDPVTGTWTPTGSMNDPRRVFQATLLLDGRVLATGGLDGGQGRYSTAESYDPAIGNWSRVNAMSTGRYHHSATLLPNGRVLVAGGDISAVAFIATTEEFNPVTGTWGAYGTMNIPHGGHTATLLPNGNVLVAGGLNRIGNVIDPVTTAELYAKAPGTIVVGDLIQTYDGTPRSVFVTTVPPGLNVDVTYNGSSLPPISVGSYVVVATIDDADYEGSVTNTLLIGASPAIISQPLSLTNNVGTAATFTVIADGTPPLNYQWQKDGTNFIGTNSPVLVLTNLQKSDEGFYSVVVSSPYGLVTSSNAFLRVNRAPIADASATTPLVISLNEINAPVVLDGTRSSDPDGDALVYSWYESGNPTPLAQGATATVTLPVGLHSIQLVVSDGLAADTNGITVTVVSITGAIDRLMSIVRTNASHPQPLLASLSAAKASTGRGNQTAAINQLQAFQNKVLAQDQALDPKLAASLVESAQEIIYALGGIAGKHPQEARAIRGIKPQPNGHVRLQFTAPSGSVSLIEASTNLTDWETIGAAVQNADGSFSFEDADAAKLPGRFYRVVSP